MSNEVKPMSDGINPTPPANPAPAPVQETDAIVWTEAGEGDTKSFTMTGPQTGNQYRITKGTGGKYILSIDGNKVEGVRGTIAGMKREAEKREKELSAPPASANPPEAKPAPAPSPAPVNYVGGNGSLGAVEATAPAPAPVVQAAHKTADPVPDEVPTIELTERESNVLLAIGGNPANDGDAMASSWFAEVVKSDQWQAFTLGSLSARGFVWAEENEAGGFCGLTETGLSIFDELNINAGMNEVQPATAGSAPVGPVQVSTLKRGQVFTFVDPRHGTVGRVERVQSHEVTCTAELNPGQFRTIFLTPKVMVTHGANLPKGFPPPVEKKGNGERTAPDRVVTVKTGKKHKGGKVKAGSTDGATIVHGVPVEVKDANGDGGKQRVKVFGMSVTAVLRWMGADGWSMDKARKALTKLGLDIGEQTITSQVYSGRDPDSPRGDVPELSKEQGEALRALYRMDD